MKKLNIKSKLLLIITVVICLTSHSQEYDSTKFQDWKNGLIQNELLNEMDLSEIFLYENCNYIGVFGNNMHKIQIRFDSIKQNKYYPERYEVFGKSLLKDNICPLIGYLKIERLELNTFDTFIAIGSYEFFESNTIPQNVFRGNFRKFFSYSIENNRMEHFSDTEIASRKEGFAGYWLDVKRNKRYLCLFGFFQYPYSLVGDFDNRGGEPLIPRKFKQFGWESNFNGDFGTYSNIECDNRWWLEK